MAEHPPSRATAESLVRRWRAASGPASSARGDGGLPARLSFAQEGVWLAERLRARIGTDEQATVVFAGVTGAPLYRAALASAVEHIGQQHPVLLAGVRADSDFPRQALTAHPRLRLDLAEAASCGEDGLPADAELARIAQLTAAEPFDLEHGPLARVRLITLSPARDLLVIAAHHLAADGWSMAALLAELITAYDARTFAAPAVTPELTRPSDDTAGVRFGGFADRQRAEAGTGRWQAGIGYWREQLRDLDSPQFPAGYPAPADLHLETGWREVVFSTELSDGVRALARGERATPFTVLLASLQLALGRWTGHQDVVIGCPAASRRAGMHRLVGLVANLMLLRADLADDPSFRDLLRRGRRDVAEALAHQDVPFEHLARELRLPGASTGGELFPLGFTWESWPMPDLALGGSPVRRIEAGAGRPLHLIELYLREEQDVIRGRAEFDRHRIRPEIVTRLMSCWQRLLAGALAQPDRPGSALPFTSPADVRQQAARSGRSVTVPDVPVTDRFARWAAAAPGQPAVSGDGQLLTYRQLDAATDRLARVLRGLGTGPGVVVATLLPRSPELVIAMLAVLKAGGAYLPLDPALPEDYRQRQLSGAAAAAVITHQPSRLPLDIPQIPVAGPDSGPAIRIDVAAPLDAGDGGAVGQPQVGDPAYAIYTSGSTGTPKAVVITHRSLANLCAWHHRAYRVTPRDRASQVASPAFDAAGWEIWPYLTAGASVHIMPDAVRADPAAVVTWLAASEITACFLPTPLAELVLGEPGLARVPLRVLLTGGDRLTRRRPPGASFQLANNYGPTEATVVATWDVVPDDGAEPGPPPIGRPIDNCLVRVCDQNRQPVPAGAPGELYIGGAGLAAGYLGQPDLTAQHFVTDHDGTALYRTGDRVRLREDGRLEFLGRLDRQVKVRGIRIEPAEVEAVVARHPSVTQAVADELDGRLVAWVVPRPGHVITGHELRRWMAQHSPAHLIPAQWIVLTELPVTGNGKRDRLALAAAARRPASAPEDRPAAGPLEAILAEAWSAALSLDSVGPQEDFFAMGGDSLAAMRIASLARRNGLAVNPEDVLRHPTIRDLAAVAAAAGAAAPAEPATPAGGPVPARGAPSSMVPLMPCQQELLARGWRAPHRWDQCVLFEVDEALDPGLLAEIATLLTDRHDSLRLRFTRTGDGWQQAVGPAAGGYGTIVHALDLTGHAPAGWPRLLAGTAAALQDARDLANGPLMSLVTAHGGPGRANYLLTSIHHLAVDALSVWILLNDLFTAYRQRRDGQPIELPPPTTPYAAWARLAAAAAHAPRVRSQEAYWREQCRPGAAIPCDHDTGPMQTGSNERRSIVLDASLTRRLIATGVPVRDVLLTAVAMTLAQPGAGSLVVDVRDHGRRLPGHEIDLSWTTGWFMNIYPIRLPAEAASSAELLAETGRRVAGVPDHGLGYSLLHYLTNGGRAGLASPAPVSVNYVGNLGSGLPAGVRPVLDQIIVNPDGRVASRCPVQISAGIIADQLRVECFFSRHRFREPTINSMAEQVEAALRDLIDGRCPSAARDH